MGITLHVPDALASAIVSPHGDPTRAALEAVGLKAYRQHRLKAFQLRELLEIESRFELDALLKEYEVFDYTMEDFEQDLVNLERLGLRVPQP